MYVKLLANIYNNEFCHYFHPGEQASTMTLDHFNDASTRMCYEYDFPIMASLCVLKEAHEHFRAIHLQLCWPGGWVVDFTLGTPKSGAGLNRFILCGVKWKKQEKTPFI